jgi:hypothetical protein
MCFRCLFEFPDDDSLGIESCGNVECHLLNCVAFDSCVVISTYVGKVTQLDNSE